METKKNDSFYLLNSAITRCPLFSNLEELHLKLQIGMGRNDIAGTLCAVAIVGRNVENGRFTEAHLHHPLVPTANDLSNSNLEGKGLAAIQPCFGKKKKSQTES